MDRNSQRLSTAKVVTQLQRAYSQEDGGVEGVGRVRARKRFANIRPLLSETFDVDDVSAAVVFAHRHVRFADVEERWPKTTDGHFAQIRQRVGQQLTAQERA